MIRDTQSAQISQKQDGGNIYAIMKTMCPSGYHHNGFVATHALGHMMYGYVYICIYIKQTNKIRDNNNRANKTTPPIKKQQKQQ